jgi:glucosamine 6-phosphate synthetase-like amidotransferase/phosphosugar isomerase protein
MSNNKKIKNLKIDPEVHDILKKYCDKKGYKIYNTSKIVSRHVDTIDMEISQIMKGTYAHFMEKEIL